MKIIKLNKKNEDFAIKKTKEILKKDGLVVIPSDTAYGLAGNAISPKVAKKILDFKGRNYGKGISIFLKDLSEIKKYAIYSPKQKEIINTLLPGKFTIVLKSKQKVTKDIEAEDKTIGIRVVNHHWLNKLLKSLNFPITATSANLSGKGPHYSISSFLKTLSSPKKKAIDLIIDAGKLKKTPTSTVIRLINNNLEILRKGLLNPILVNKTVSFSEKETKKYARNIFEKFFKKALKKSAVIVIIQGKLGVGKTIFAKGIGENFNQNLVSPTFSLIDEYQINQKPIKNLYHLDLYRIESEKELENLKLEKLLKTGNLLLIEWGEKLSILEKFKNKNNTFFMVKISDYEPLKREIKIYKL